MDLGEDLIVAKITSSAGKHRVPITQADLITGHLKKEPSYVDCSSIFTVEKKLVVKVAGKLTSEAMGRVKEELRCVLGLKPGPPQTQPYPNLSTEP